MYWLRDWPRFRPDLPAELAIVETSPGPVIAIETLREQCRVIATEVDSDGVESNPDEDPMLLAYLDAAVEYAEDFTGLAIAQRTYDLALDALPCGGPWHRVTGVSLLRPLVNVVSFVYAEGSDGELDPGDHYTVDTFRGMVRPVTSWPSMTAAANAVRIRFQAGYRNGVNDDSDFAGAPMLPAAIKQALLLLVGHFFENRADTVEKAVSTIPTGVNALLGFKRVRLGMA